MPSPAIATIRAGRLQALDIFDLLRGQDLGFEIGDAELPGDASRPSARLSPVSITIFSPVDPQCLKRCAASVDLIGSATASESERSSRPRATNMTVCPVMLDSRSASARDRGSDRSQALSSSSAWPKNHPLAAHATREHPGPRCANRIARPAPGRTGFRGQRSTACGQRMLALCSRPGATFEQRPCSSQSGGR